MLPQAVEMSFDHKPYNAGEQARIEGAGGTVSMRRVNGDLAVSRALGDFTYKHSPHLPAEKQQVSPEPEIKAEPRSLEKDQFLVLACDGIWDVMTNDEVAEFVLAKVEDGEEAAESAAAAPGPPVVRTPACSPPVCLLGAGVESLEVLAGELIDECLNKGSRDNMSVVLVAFPGAPKPSK
jgi:protein phosphatase 1B